MNIEINYAPDTNLTEMLTIRTAANYWESNFTDDLDVDIKIAIGFKDDVGGGDAIATTWFNTQSIANTDYLEALSNDATTSQDWEFLWDFEPQLSGAGASTVMTTAQLKGLNALPIKDAIEPERFIDGHILFSRLEDTELEWSTAREIGIEVDSDEVDLLGTAIVEIGKVLGADLSELPTVNAGEIVQKPSRDLLTGLDIRGFDRSAVSTPALADLYRESQAQLSQSAGISVEQLIDMPNIEAQSLTTPVHYDVYFTMSHYGVEFDSVFDPTSENYPIELYTPTQLGGSEDILSGGYNLSEHLF